MSAVKKFQRKTENFICAYCGAAVKGNGYTDHCSECLWSRHVDINPGDRQATCRGLMEPTGVEVKGGEYTIHYQCQKCGFRHRVKTAKGDNIEVMAKLSGNELD